MCKDRGYSVASIVTCLMASLLGGAFVLGVLFLLFRHYATPFGHLADSWFFCAIGLASFLLPVAWSILLTWMFRRVPFWVIPLGLPGPLAVVGWCTFRDTFFLPLPILLGAFTYALGLAGTYYAKSGLGLPLIHPGEPRCPQCGHCLYFAENCRCPECGRTFSLEELDLRLARWDGSMLSPERDS